MSDVLARAAEVLGAHRARPSGSPHCVCGWRPAMYLNDTESDAGQHRWHVAQMLADAGLLAESATVAAGNGAVSAESCPPRPTTHETLDSLTARLVAARAATDGYRTEAERLRELLDEAHAKIERMEEL